MNTIKQFIRNCHICRRIFFFEINILKHFDFYLYLKYVDQIFQSIS